jgi:hypothetical protein
MPQMTTITFQKWYQMKKVRKDPPCMGLLPTAQVLAFAQSY